LKFLTGQSASQIIKETRLKKAMDLLQNNVATSSEISYQVGFGSPSYFNTCFREYFGYPPGKVKRNRSSKTTRKHTNSRRYIFASIAIFVLVALIVFNIIPRLNPTIETEIPDKSIAVLPFKSLSDDPEQQYLADGVMYAILLHLSKIEDLHVLSWASVEQYRTTDKTATEICQELDVGYLLLGRFRKHGDQARLIVELIQSGKEDQVWTDEYDREWKDIFTVESEVAQIIAGELNAAISPEEKELIEKIPTTNLTAHDFYQRGREEYNHYWLDNDNRTALERAEELYQNALDYDSTFALAYTGLAYIYWDKHYWDSYFSKSFLDSVLILADKALSFDPQLSDAYTVRGDFYREKDQNEQAINEYEKAINLNPNDWWAYHGIGITYRDNHDYVKAIDNLHEAASLYRGPLLPSLLRSLAESYRYAGFLEKSKFYIHEAYLLDGDSIRYYYILAFIEYYKGNHDKHGKSLESIYFMDTTRNNVLLDLGNTYGNEGKYEESLFYLKKYYNRLETFGYYDVQNVQRLGLAYWMNGYKTEANFYFDQMIEYYNNLTDVGRIMYATNYDLASVYAFRGEKDRAYENLRKFIELERIPLWWLQLFRIDPLFDSIRDEPEFQQILRDVEDKYHAEHDRVGLWLEENDML
jgi:TolB-like protein